MLLNVIRIERTPNKHKIENAARYYITKTFWNDTTPKRKKQNLNQIMLYILLNLYDSLYDKNVVKSSTSHIRCIITIYAKTRPLKHALVINPFRMQKYTINTSCKIFIITTTGIKLRRYYNNIKWWSDGFRENSFIGLLL